MQAWVIIGLCALTGCHTAWRGENLSRCTADGATPAGQSKLVFRSGFSLPELVGLSPSNAVDRTFTDVRTGYTWGEPWRDEDGAPFVRSSQTAGWGQDPHQVVELVEDPLEPGNLVLHTVNASDVMPPRSYQARVALRLFPQLDDARTSQFFARYRLRLDPSLASVSPGAAWTWFNIIEVKERQEAPFFFTGVGLHKSAGGPIVWEMEGRHRLPTDTQFKNVWQATRPDVPVPLGKWFTLEYLYRRDATAGRIRLAITVDGRRHVLFDFDQTAPSLAPQGFVTAEPSIDGCNPLEAWEIMKTYVGPPRDVRTMLGEPIDAWYDDLEVWTGEP